LRYPPILILMGKALWYHYWCYYPIPCIHLLHRSNVGGDRWEQGSPNPNPNLGSEGFSAGPLGFGGLSQGPGRAPEPLLNRFDQLLFVVCCLLLLLLVFLCIFIFISLARCRSNTSREGQPWRASRSTRWTKDAEMARMAHERPQQCGVLRCTSRVPFVTARVTCSPTSTSLRPCRPRGFNPTAGGSVSAELEEIWSNWLRQGSGFCTHHLICNMETCVHGCQQFNLSSAVILSWMAGCVEYSLKEWFSNPYMWCHSVFIFPCREYKGSGTKRTRDFPWGNAHSCVGCIHGYLEG